MSSLPIISLPTASLRERSVEVDPSLIGTPDFQAFLDVMIESMWAADGVGLAAPQVGRNERVIIVNLKSGVYPLVNPVIEKMFEATIEGEEGCLSVPRVWGTVERAKRVTVTALNRHGRRETFDVKDSDAVVFQHEVDHLDGILFIDKAVEITKGEENLKAMIGGR
ncbi:peptide deformylase [Patescibacteria group bacterium]|nr:peptide deformylase [Patescibacteria group bacterium]MBU1448422.1 peptide deformylase [Patescibacteria group bacterium]MBU2613486.1 peptide deformylase [Patescibacteria group bacterium]